MNRTPNRLIGILLLGVFAFFYCGNTLFLHSHNLGDVKIVHSHPYLPSGHHSHSQQSIDSIAGFNTALLSMLSCEQHEVNSPDENAVILASAPAKYVTEKHISGNRWRAPPKD